MELEKRVENLESRTTGIEFKVADLDKNQALFSQSLEQFTKSNEKFNEFADRAIVTLTKMEDRISYQEIHIAENEQDINKVKEELKEIDKKGKFDIVEQIKNNFVTIIILVILLLQHAGLLDIIK